MPHLHLAHSHTHTAARQIHPTIKPEALYTSKSTTYTNKTSLLLLTSSVEYLDHFENHQQQQCQHDDQQEDAQPALPVAAVLQHVPHTFGRRAQACVCHIDVFVKLFKQSGV